MFFRIFLLTTEPCCDIITVLSNMVGVAQSIRAPGCGPGGRGFEPHYSPHFFLLFMQGRWGVAKR